MENATPRDGSGIHSKPPGTSGVPNTTIETAKYNGFCDDLVADLNAARPITAGGTGATNAASARANLGLSTGTGWGDAFAFRGADHETAGFVVF